VVTDAVQHGDEKAGQGRLETKTVAQPAPITAHGEGPRLDNRAQVRRPAHAAGPYYQLSPLNDRLYHARWSFKEVAIV
jgi:hypothetical protein